MAVFQAAMYAGAWFSPKIKQGIEGRKELLKKLELSLPALVNGRQVAWFHAASLGEFEQGRPVMEKFRIRYPDHFILLTFFSPSGYEIRKNYGGADHICYLPIDTKKNAMRFVQLVKPQIVFFIKYEFWFNYLRELRENNAYILSFSTIFRPGQAFFKSYGGFYRKLLTYFDHILVQNQESLDLMHQIGINNCSLAGDSRFDRVSTIADNVIDLPLIARFLEGKPCLVAGSVWEADMQVLIPALNALKEPLKVIIAPHEIKPEEIATWRKKISGSSVLYSEYKKNTDNQPYNCLIIDNIGMLSSLYRYGTVAYIGGSFGSGLHNILEAATFGLPVIFGNKGYHKFQEAKDLILEGGAVAVADSNEITQLLSNWNHNPEIRMAIGDISRNYVVSRKGATDKIMQETEKLLDR
ncbi:3-deoxy-D-manno-octulosonic acid transferase [Dyadobacter sp. NIV53]|uniref:3-deoxy-D-manno-octulosonic acid transferase n=1 Tax=Dyadobacter sp. NIV53 TaxID=2861765 RepID=UPI001C87D2D6|nr:glycosyltransferase N-terminal domain-containing protein [Dyadobacter sp. NIV53]